MALRAWELYQIATELQQRLGGAVVQKVYVPDSQHCLLEVRVPGRSLLLGASIAPGSGRLSLWEARPPSPKEALPFQGKLRHELTGARVGAVRWLGLRRVALELLRKQGSRWWVIDLSPAGFVGLTDGQGRVLATTPPGQVKAGELLCLDVASAPEAGESRLQADADPLLPLSRSAETVLAPKETHRRADEVRRQLLAPLKTRLARLNRTVDKVRAEGSRSDEAETHRRTGELLSQNLHLLSRGAKTVRLTEYTEQGPVEREVHLNPKLAPKEQAERHFHQYRRLLRGAEHAARRLEELAAELKSTQARIDFVSSAAEEELVSQVPTLPPPKSGPPKARPFREYLSANGQRIWVGRNARDNDQLTFRLARPQDIWFHARGVPGSHVVVPREKNQPLLPEVLLDAATLALHHSEAKGEPRGEVSHTEVKYVRRPKGGAPGQVSFTREKTLLVRLEPERLSRLLRSREEL